MYSRHCTFFFLLEILSKKNTMFWVAWPKFSCTFASLPNFLFLAKQFIISLVLYPKGFAGTNNYLVSMSFQRRNSFAFPHLFCRCKNRNVFNLWECYWGIEKVLITQNLYNLNFKELMIIFGVCKENNSFQVVWQDRSGTSVWTYRKLLPWIGVSEKYLWKRFWFCLGKNDGLKDMLYAGLYKTTILSNN